MRWLWNFLLGRSSGPWYIKNWNNVLADRYARQTERYLLGDAGRAKVSYAAFWQAVDAKPGTRRPARKLKPAARVLPMRRKA